MKTKKCATLFLLILIFSLIMSGCGVQDNEEVTANEEAVEINISAAASLTDALNEIKDAYAEESNDILMFNFAGSGSLQKQIQEGAPCDLYISASKKHMDALNEAGFIVTDTRKDLLGNVLTLIVSSEKADDITELASLNTDAVSSIAIGTPESVPAGDYAKQALEAAGIWDSIQTKLVLAKDVKQVLEYVNTGNVDCGLVYASDALMLETGEVVTDIPEESHSPIIYPAAILTAASQPEAAQAFYDFLSSDAAASIFEKYGFTVL